MKIHVHALRTIHKWIGLVIGLQFLLWALSGTVMAILPMDDVAGGKRPAPAVATLAATDGWGPVQRHYRGRPITGVSLRPLLDRHVLEVSTATGIDLFDAATGRPIGIDGDWARRIAIAAYAGKGTVSRVVPLDEISLAVRDHQLPIWRIDFADPSNSSIYVSGSTGDVLERRNDVWRVWDVFWMLHNMDYLNRSSFNHPLIIAVCFAAAWLAITGVWLLFRTGWRSDFKRLRSRSS